MARVSSTIYAVVGDAGPVLSRVLRNALGVAEPLTGVTSVYLKIRKSLVPGTILVNRACTIVLGGHLETGGAAIGTYVDKVTWQWLTTDFAAVDAGSGQAHFIVHRPGMDPVTIPTVGYIEVVISPTF